LQARATKGVTILQDNLETTGAAAALQLTLDQPASPENGPDVAIVAVKVVDDRGSTVPTAANALTFAVEGPGKIIGVGNGDPSSHEPDQAASGSAFNGMAMVLIKTDNQNGTLRVSATSPGLKAGEIVLR
jgi:beta-galactosidase